MFVGREDSVRLVRAAVAAGRPVLVVGEAGIGKSALVRQSVGDSAAPTQRARAKRRSGHQPARRVFEGGALGMLDWREFFALERAVGRPVNGVDPAAVAIDVQETVQDGVLVLEDLHWAAPATLHVLEALAGRIAIVGTVRTADAGAAAALEILGAAGFTEIELEPLDSATAAELVRAARPGLGTPAVASLVRRSGGIPLLLTELGSDGTASAGLRRSVAARLRDLDAPAREVFTLVAVAGSALREEMLNPAGVKALRTANLVVEQQPGRLAPRHSLLGEIAVEALTPTELREFNADVARLVDSPGEAARHHAAAGERDLAHANALRAATEATTPGERAGHLRLAAATVSGPGADDLRLAAGRALAEGFDWSGVDDILRQVSPDAAPDIRAEAWLLRARGAWARGAAEEMAPALEAGLQACAGRNSAMEVLLRIEGSRIAIWIEADPVGHLATAAANLALALDRGVGVARARYYLGTATAMTGDPEGLSILAAAVESARQDGDYDTEFTAANNLISFLESDGDPAVGRDYAARMRDRAHELGLGMWENSMRYQITQLDFHAGRCLQVLPETTDLLRLPLDPRTRDSTREVHCMALIDLGRIEEADRLAVAWMAEAVDDQQGAAQFLWVRAEAALCGGRPADAVTLMDEFLTLQDSDPNLVLGRLTRAWARFGIGHYPGDPPEDPGRRMLDGVVPEITGIVHLHAGRYAEAAEQFAAAVGLWRPYHRRGSVRCAWAQGEALRLAGDLDAAIPVLHRAESAADELGFVGHAGWARHSLRQAGERRTAARGSAVGGLTISEARVLALVVEGLTNPQIADRLGLSPRTVITQIESAATRLGATGRTQAAAMYRSLRGADRP